MRLLADPAEAFAQYGWYLVGAAVLYFYVLRPYVDGEVARRKLAEANDPSRRRALDEKRAAAIADRQASLDKAAKERPPPPKPWYPRLRRPAAPPAPMVAIWRPPAGRTGSLTARWRRDPWT